MQSDETRLMRSEPWMAESRSELPAQSPQKLADTVVARKGAADGGSPAVANAREQANEVAAKGLLSPGLSSSKEDGPSISRRDQRSESEIRPLSGASADGGPHAGGPTPGPKSESPRMPQKGGTRLWHVSRTGPGDKPVPHSAPYGDQGKAPARAELPTLPPPSASPSESASAAQDHCTAISPSRPAAARRVAELPTIVRKPEAQSAEAASELPPTAPVDSPTLQDDGLNNSVTLPRNAGGAVLKKMRELYTRLVGQRSSENAPPEPSSREQERRKLVLALAAGLLMAGGAVLVPRLLGSGPAATTPAMAPAPSSAKEASDASGSGSAGQSSKAADRRAAGDGQASASSAAGTTPLVTAPAAAAAEVSAPASGAQSVRQQAATIGRGGRRRERLLETPAPAVTPRVAIDALASGDHGAALAHYRALMAAQPQVTAYREAVAILERWVQAQQPR